MTFGTLTAPPETIAALRDIDPAADLVHLENDVWLLGIRAPNPGAQERLQRQLKLLDPVKGLSYEMGLEFQLLQFFASGFRPIQMYRLGERTPEGEIVTFGWIVEDFRIRDFNWRVRQKESEAEFRAAISLDEGNKWRRRVLEDWAEAEGPSMWRFVFAKAKSFWQRLPFPKGE